MILTAQKIKEEMELGNIIISSPFDLVFGANSVDLTLSPYLLRYRYPYLDMKENNEMYEEVIPERGFILKPNTLYLGSTNEYTKTKRHVPLIEGRSSVGRLGINIHFTAGFGDIGYEGRWTLEISCIQDVRIYPNVRICQIYYHTVDGKIEKTYEGKYQGTTGIMGSKMYLDKEMKP